MAFTSGLFPQLVVTVASKFKVVSSAQIAKICQRRLSMSDSYSDVMIVDRLLTNWKTRITPRGSWNTVKSYLTIVTFLLHSVWYEFVDCLTTALKLKGKNAFEYSPLKGIFCGVHIRVLFCNCEILPKKRSHWLADCDSFECFQPVNHMLRALCFKEPEASRNTNVRAISAIERPDPIDFFSLSEFNLTFWLMSFHTSLFTSKQHRNFARQPMPVQQLRHAYWQTIWWCRWYSSWKTKLINQDRMKHHRKMLSFRATKTPPNLADVCEHNNVCTTSRLLLRLYLRLELPASRLDMLVEFSTLCVCICTCCTLSGHVLSPRILTSDFIHLHLILFSDTTFFAKLLSYCDSNDNNNNNTGTQHAKAFFNREKWKNKLPSTACVCAIQFFQCFQRVSQPRIASQFAHCDNYLSFWLVYLFIDPIEYFSKLYQVRAATV